MVYCGKPSGSCHSCREKKTRVCYTIALPYHFHRITVAATLVKFCNVDKPQCDQRLPGCTQCERAKRVCPGYRVPGDLLFRNESDNVIRKFKAKEIRAKNASIKSAVLVTDILNPNPSEKSGTNEVEENQEVTLSGSTLDNFSSLPTNIEDQAAAFFIFNYAVCICSTLLFCLNYTIILGNYSSYISQPTLI